MTLNTYAPPALPVQTAANQLLAANPAASITTSLPSPISAIANFVVAYAFQYSSTNPITISAPGWIVLWAVQDIPNNRSSTLAVAPQGSFNIQSLTANGNASTRKDLVMAEISNITALDTFVNTGRLAAASTARISITTTTPSIVIAAFADDAGGVTFTPGTGWTTLVGNNDVFLEYQDVTISGTVTATVSKSPGVQAWIAGIIDFTQYSQALFQSNGEIAIRITLPNGNQATFGEGADDGSVRRGLAGPGQTAANTEFSNGQPIDGAAVNPTWAPSNWETS